MKMSALLLMLVGSMLVGCNGTVTNFVKGVAPGRAPASSPLSATGPMELKVSPGKLSGQSQDISASGNVTITNRSLTSQDISAQVTLSRVRVSP